MSHKIERVFKENGIPGFFVDVKHPDREGPERFHFTDDMLEGDKFFEEIRKTIGSRQKTAEKQLAPGALSFDSVKQKFDGKAFEPIEFQEARPCLTCEAPKDRKH